MRDALGVSVTEVALVRALRLDVEPDHAETACGDADPTAVTPVSVYHAGTAGVLHAYGPTRTGDQAFRTEALGADAHTGMIVREHVVQYRESGECGHHTTFVVQGTDHLAGAAAGAPRRVSRNVCGRWDHEGLRLTGRGSPATRDDVGASGPRVRLAVRQP